MLAKKPAPMNRPVTHMRMHKILAVTALSAVIGFFSCSGQQRLNEPESDIRDELSETFPEAVAEEAPLPEEEIVVSYDEETLWAAYQERTNRALEYLLMAQIAMEAGLFNNALYQINLSLAILQTADGLAHKGSILYMLNRHDEARTFWQQAYELDPEALDAKLPGIPEGLD